jgi:hypothetical protein
MSTVFFFDPGAPCIERPHVIDMITAIYSLDPYGEVVFKSLFGQSLAHESYSSHE